MSSVLFLIPAEAGTPYGTRWAAARSTDACATWGGRTTYGVSPTLAGNGTARAGLAPHDGTGQEPTVYNAIVPRPISITRPLTRIVPSASTASPSRHGRPTASP